MVLGILPMFKEVLSALLTTDDQDILDYVTGTVEQCVDDGDTSAEALTDALSDLLISYELAPDEDAASAICVSLSEQLSGSMPVSSQAEERPKLLSAPVLMGEDRADEAPISLTSRPVNMDALGNSCSMAARANAAAAAAKEGPPSKNVAEAKAEPDAGASGPAFGLLHATSVSKAEQTARDNAELEASRREREAACERYLLSKAAGGSRDVAIKGLILLAPTGKPLIDGGEDGSAKLQLVAGRRYGLVGRNGTGKSTLLKAIASYEISGFPQHLKVEHTLHPAPCTLRPAPCALRPAPCTLYPPLPWPLSYRYLTATLPLSLPPRQVVHVEQDPRHDLDASPLSTVLGYDLERSLLRRRLTDLGAKLEEAAQTAEVAAPGEKAAADRHAARVQKRCEEAEALLAELGDEEVAEAKAASILAGLQFSSEMMSAPLRTLSGGWRMRVTLAAALFVPCDVRCRSTLRPRPFALDPPPSALHTETPRHRDTETPSRSCCSTSRPTTSTSPRSPGSPGGCGTSARRRCSSSLTLTLTLALTLALALALALALTRTLTRRRCSSSPTTAASSTTWSRTSCSCVGAT